MKKLFKKKQKNENPIYMLFLFLIFAIAILFFIIKLISGIFQNDSGYDLDNMNQYIEDQDGNVSDEKIVKDYSKFQTIQSILEQFTDALLDKKFEESYNVLDSDYKKKFESKDDYIGKIEKYTSDYLTPRDANTAYVNKNKLKKTYQLSDSDYLAQYEVSNGEMKSIGIRLDFKNEKYSIFYIEM